MVKATRLALILIGLLPLTVAFADSTESTLDKLEFQDSSTIGRARTYSQPVAADPRGIQDIAPVPWR